VKHFSSKQRFVAAVAVVFLVLFFLRPGAQHLKTRISDSMSLALGRQVEIGSVHIRLLPRPGFDLENLVVHEDPAFGAEPMLRAQEVTALVRWTSLARGRVDIARLDLTEPSLNLVRRADGHWNLESLLELTAHTPLAPTAKSKLETRRGFPYIEGSSGRINVKMGEEKKPYALVDADFALWQESENTWGVRLKAQPVRTDVGLSDTGVLRMNGKWQRSGTLRDTPMQFSLDWSHGQLGQLTKLASGTDRGWRGGVQLDATLQGTPAALHVSMDASVQDFHRYDISSAGSLRLGAHCDAQFSSVDRVLHQVFCSAPAGNGVISLHGDVGLPGTHFADMALDAEQVPVSAMAELGRRAKKDLSPDLVAAGTMQGSFTLREGGSAPGGFQFEGGGEIDDFQLASSAGSPTPKVALGPETVPFSMESAPGGGSSQNQEERARSTANRGLMVVSGEPRLRFGPLAVRSGASAVPVVAQGWIAPSGYEVNLRGEGEVSDALRLANLLGLPALKTSAEGLAQMNLRIAGSWMGWASGNPIGFSAPKVTGTAQLHNVRVELHGVNHPVEVASAEVRLLPEEVRVERFNATAAGTRWAGTLEFPRGCGTPGDCLVRFNVNGDAIDLGELHRWLGAQHDQRKWYQVLAASVPPEPAFFGKIRATGTISASRLLIRDAVASDVSASLELDREKLKVSDLRADFLGGKYRGDWQGDFTVNPPAFASAGSMTAISLAQAAKLMHDRWVDGVAGGTYRLSASGTSAADFWSSADATTEMEVHDARLLHLPLRKDAGPLQVELFEGAVHLRGGKFEIQEASLSSSSGTFRVSGWVSLSREVDLKLARSPFAAPVSGAFRGFAITGTLAQPHVLPVPAIETQAELKRSQAHHDSLP